MPWRRLKLLLIPTLLLFPLAAGAQPEIAFEQREDALEIRIGGEVVAEYVWADPEIPRPYFKQVRTREGVQVTRNHPPDPEADTGNLDHPDFHPGIWLAFGDISGADFWRNKARVQHVGFLEAPHVVDGRGAFEVLNVYGRRRDMDSPIICEERCRYTITPADDGWLLTTRSTFHAAKEAFRYGDQEEMGFGIRLATPLSVTHGSGELLNSEGARAGAGTWGKRADWCAGFGEADGQCIGAMIVPGPDNFRPSWFHARDYGLIVANPFGKKAMTAPGDDAVAPDATAVQPGKTLTLSFAAYIFSLPDCEAPALDPLYRACLDALSR